MPFTRAVEHESTALDSFIKFVRVPVVVVAEVVVVVERERVVVR